jgi:23S rRNA pseudouridine2605 synthase
MERLQKVLAEAGIASRRKCEEIITAGRVQVNGETVTALGVKVDPDKDEIVVDGRAISLEKKVYLLLNKPKGVITSTFDPAGRKVVSDFLPGIKERVYPVGRLDYDTEGLLLLTNDGEFANLLTHPKYHIPRTYHATVKGTPHGTLLEKLQNGIQLEDGMTAPAEVDYYDINPETNETVVKITIYEGRNRQVRRMFEAISFPVIKLRRVQFGPITLAGVPRGKYRHLSPLEVKELRDSALKAEGGHRPKYGEKTADQPQTYPTTLSASTPQKETNRQRTASKTHKFQKGR